jgi:demethylmenaquinone methyltransferase/2-methoxy-6-polyprenyl-1,4-benzoquinol methylase
MRFLESTPTRYDRGIAVLTLGRLVGLQDWLATYVETGMRVLDLGTGTGALALLAASRGADVVAIDVNPGMLEIARRKAAAAGLSERITWREMGVAEIDGFREGAFDAVSAGLCLSELGTEERRYALIHARRVLYPEGKWLMVDETRPENPLARSANALIRIPMAAVSWVLTQTATRALPDPAELLKRSGFQVVDMQRALCGSLVAVVAEPSRREP